MRKHHKIVFEFQTSSDLPEYHRRKLCDSTWLMRKQFTATIADILTEAGIDARVTSSRTVERGN